MADDRALVSVLLTTAAARLDARRDALTLEAAVRRRWDRLAHALGALATVAGDIQCRCLHVADMEDVHVSSSDVGAAH